MKAIFVTGGKQYYVSEGETIYVEKLDAEVGSEVEFTEVKNAMYGYDIAFGSSLINELIEKRIKFIKHF